MKNEIDHLVSRLHEAYDGNPWFGRSLKKILDEIDADMAVHKPNGQHSILELLYHMITWREFTISRLKPEDGKTSAYFGTMNWQKLDHTDKKLWKKGLQQLDKTQKKLESLIRKLQDESLTGKVAERKYNVRFLVNGIVEHDIYHLGQIAYVMKLAKKQ